MPTKKPRALRGRRKYKWRIALSGIDPKAVANEIESIQKRDGKWTPEAHVEAAKKRTSPSHKYFTWDNTKAAQKQRLREARQLVRNLRVVVIKPGGEKADRRVHLRLTGKTGKEGAGYYPMDDIALDPKATEEVMGRAKRDLLAWIERYEELREHLPGVFESVQEIIEDEWEMAA